MAEERQSGGPNPGGRSFLPAIAGPRSTRWELQLAFVSPLTGFSLVLNGTHRFHHPSMRKDGACWGPRFRAGLHCGAPDECAWEPGWISKRNSAV